VSPASVGAARQMSMPSVNSSPRRCAGEDPKRRKRRSNAAAALSCRSGNALHEVLEWAAMERKGSCW
jgi:hypothetical protein